MKSYGQLCAVARALDVVGDRWSLLIVRELLITRRLRFSDLQRGLPGIAPNLLTQRLRDLEGTGVIRREPAMPPAAGTLYALTERGTQLDGVIRDLLRWGAGTMEKAPPNASFQMHWLSMPARYLLRDNDPTQPPVTIRFGTIADGFDAIPSAGTTTITPCNTELSPNATVDGPGPVLVQLLQGAITLEHAAANGVTIQGDRQALLRALPTAR